MGFFWLQWVFVAVRESPLVAASGDSSSGGVWASHAVASLVAEHGLEGMRVSVVMAWP